MSIRVFNDEFKTYRTFDDLDEFLGAYSTLNYCHEVIEGACPQRVRYDIDDGKLELKNPADLIKRLIQISLDIYYDLYSAQVVGYYTEEDFIVCNSSDHTKTSFHIIAPFYGATNSDVLFFVRLVAEKLLPGDLNYVDLGVYKSRQNFRLYDAAKFEHPTRVKKYFTGPTNIDLRIACLIGHYDPSKPITPFVTGAPINQILPSYGDSDREWSPELNKIIAPYIADHVLRSSYQSRGSNAGMKYIFNRLRPSYCEICDRTHDKDNTLIISTLVEGSQPVFMRCRRNNGFKVLGHLGQCPASESISQVIDSLSSKKEEEEIILAKSGIIESYKEPTLRPFPGDVPTLLVRAPMKIGKTKTLIQYINRCHPKSTVIFVTFRQTFSRSLEKSLNDSGIPTTNYMDVTDRSISIYKYPRAIIQVESLNRLQVLGMPAPNLLVLDESESIFEQYASGNIRDIHAAFATLEWLVRMSGVVIAMDANLGERTSEMVRTLRPAKPPHTIINSFPNAKGDKYYFIEKKESWYGHIILKLKMGLKVAVFLNSLKEAQILERALHDEFTEDKKIYLYSSETMAAVKNEHFADVHQHWGDLDALICTPTVSAGVSFELPWFDIVYGYFSDQSCSVETSRQMIGRIRNVTLREYYIHLALSPRGGGLPTKLDEIRTLMRTRRAFLSDLNKGEGKSLDIPLSFRYDDEGIPHYDETPLHLLYMLNLRHANISRLFFAKKFIQQVSAIGAEVIVYKEIHNLDIDLRTVREDLSVVAAKTIANALPITADEAAEIAGQYKSSNNKLTPDHIASLHKYQIEKLYNVKIKPEQYQFVRTHGSYRDRAIFRNLREIALVRDGTLTMETILLSLKYSVDPNALAPSTIYERHYTAARLVRAIGFDSIFDAIGAAEITSETLFSRLDALRPELTSNYSKLVFMVGHTLPKITDNVISLLKLVNSLLALYGSKLKKKRNQDEYVLEFPRKFLPYLPVTCAISGSFAS